MIRLTLSSPFHRGSVTLQVGKCWLQEKLIPLPLRLFLFFDVFVVLFNGIIMCLSIALVTI